MCQPSVWKCLHGYMAKTHLPVLLNVVNSRCHTQLGQEMDRIRLCDIGRRNIQPTVRSVDRVLENSSEVGEKAGYPVYQPCKKELGFMNVYSHWLSPLSFVFNSSSHHDYFSTHKKIPVRSSLPSLLTPSPHFRSYLNIKSVLRFLDVEERSAAPIPATGSCPPERTAGGGS